MVAYSSLMIHEWSVFWISNGRAWCRTQWSSFPAIFLMLQICKGALSLLLNSPTCGVWHHHCCALVWCFYWFSIYTLIGFKHDRMWYLLWCTVKYALPQKNVAYLWVVLTAFGEIKPSLSYIWIDLLNQPVHSMWDTVKRGQHRMTNWLTV